jgi:hypothetical protein
MTSAPAQVPDDASAVKTIEPILRRIVLNIYDEVPVQADIRTIEEYLSERERLINSQALDASYDWAGDLRIARIHQQIGKDWLPHHQDIRDRYIKYWRDLVERSSTYQREMSLSGMKTLLLLHGAVALGALNAIIQNEAPQHVLLAARLALAFSLIGIFALGAGQVIGIYYSRAVSDAITRQVWTKTKWSKVRALSRYTAA